MALKTWIERLLGRGDKPSGERSAGHQRGYRETSHDGPGSATAIDTPVSEERARDGERADVGGGSEGSE